MLWNVKDVANYLGISGSMVYKMVSGNELPCIRIGDCIRFNPDTIDILIKKNTKESKNGIEIPKEYIMNNNFNSQYWV